MNNLINKYKQMLEPVKGLLRDPIKGTDIDNKIMSAGAGVARTLPSIARGIAKETIIPAAQAVGNAPAFYLKTLPYAKREAEKSANRYLNQQMAATKAQEMGRYDMAKTLMNNSLQDKRKTESYYQMLDPIRYQMAKESGIGGAKSLLNAAGASVIKASAAGATTLGARGLAMAKAASVPTAIGGGLGGVFAAASGQNVGEGIGQGIGSGLQSVGLQKFTAPIIDPVVDYVGRGKPVVQKYLARALAQGGLNTAEDNLFSVGTQGKKQNADENVLSFLIGAAISPFTSYNPDQSFLKIVDDRLVFDGKRYRNALGEYAKITGEPLNVVKRKAKQATKYLEEEVPIPLTRGGEIIGYTKIKRIKAMMQDQSGGVGLDKPGYFDGGGSASAKPQSANINTLRKQVSQELSQNQASAQIAKQARESLGDDLVGKINQLKKVAKTKTFAQGDIETLRASKHGKLTNEVVESIQEARPDLDEAGALDFALSLPTKAETRVRKPAELKTLRELESRQKVEQQLWEQEFGRNLNEKEYRKLEREWLKSYTSENKTTPKIKGKQERAAVRQNEQALRRLESEWVSQANPGTIKPYKRGDLGTQQPFEILKDFSKANDKAAWKYSRETAVRNIEDTFGPQAPAVKKFVTDRVEANELASTKFLQDTAGRLKQVVNKNGIRKGSIDDALVFRFAEGRMSLDELKAQSKNWQGIADTATTFRTTYDELLDKINASLTKFGYDPIPKRKDYMTHFQEVGSFFSNFGMMFQDKTLRDNLGDKLPTAMSGINMDTRPGKEFFKYALPRTGDKFTESAIGAMERYLPTASRQIFHTDSVQRVRALQSLIEQRAGAQGKDLSNFNSWLSEYGNLLAGKKATLDRPVEKYLGRNVLKFANTIKQRSGANMVGGNVASALTNFIPLTQSLATTSKPAVMKGLLGAVSTDPTKIGGVESSFLTRRFADFSIDRNWSEKAGNAAGWLFKAVDHFVGRTIVGSKFHEGLSKGFDATSAMRRADDYAARVMADRSFGSMPVIFNSQVAGALTQFQLEVNNQLSFIMKDIPKNLNYDKKQVASSIGQLVIYSYLFNNLYEKLTGRRPAFDPLGVAIQAGQDYTNEDLKEGQATKNLTKNIAQQLPFVGSLVEGGRLPISSALPDVPALINGETTLKKEAMKPLANLALPFGGGQTKKSVEGLRAYNKGASVTDSGRVRYGIKKNPANLIRTAIFGQYSTPEAREYFRAGKAPMGENQSKYALKQPDVSGTINYMQGVKQSIDGKKVNQASVVSSIENPLYFDENTGETKVIKVAQVASMPESTNYERALKQKAAWGTVGDIVDNLQGTERSQALKAIGVSETDAVYYNVARQDNDIKYAYLTDFMGNIQDRNQLMQALIAGRKKVNDKNIVSDGVLDQLYDDGLISYSERKQLKAIKDLDTNSRPVAKKSSGSGKKIKAPKVKKIKLTTSGVSERVKRVKQRRSKQYSLTKVKKLTG